MRSGAHLFGHPLHPMLVMFPTALLPLLIVMDVIHWWTGDAGAWTAGFWIVVVGLATTAAAIVPGIVDLARIPDATKAHRIGVFHMIVGFTILATYGAALWARWPVGSAPDRFALAFGIDVLGTLLVTLQGWLGGELVYKHHVGVESEAEGGEPVAAEGAAGHPRGSLRRSS